MRRNYKNSNLFKKIINVSIYSLLLINISIYMSQYKIVYAESKSNLELKLEEQEEDLKENIGDIVPDAGNTIESSTDMILNQTVTGESNIKNIVEKGKELLSNLLIKTRTLAIIAYGIFVVVTLIYMATVGSRSLNKRRSSLLSLIGFTVLFVVYINLPLLVLYIQADKSALPNITIYQRAAGILDFFKSNSLIISLLLIFLGLSKIIISKNDLPSRNQGKYLLKFSVINFIVLNTIAMAINFIV